MSLYDVLIHSPRTKKHVVRNVWQDSLRLNMAELANDMFSKFSHDVTLQFAMNLIIICFQQGSFLDRKT